jgi:hypothetical protein
MLSIESSGQIGKDDDRCSPTIADIEAKITPFPTVLAGSSSLMMMN